MAKVHKITLYIADRGQGDGFANFNGDLYHGKYSSKIVSHETVDVDGEYHDDHVLNKSDVWNDENNDFLTNLFNVLTNLFNE